MGKDNENGNGWGGIGKDGIGRNREGWGRIRRDGNGWGGIGKDGVG